MSHPYRNFEPNWVKGEFPKDSYRSIFKWGAPQEIKAPRESLYKLMKEKFHLTDEDFQNYREDIGFDAVSFDLPIRLTSEDLSAFAEIVGNDFVRTDDYARLSVAYGKTMYDLLHLRNKIGDDKLVCLFIKLHKFHHTWIVIPTLNGSSSKKLLNKFWV